MASDNQQQYTMGRSEHETQRLIAQSHLYENITMRFLASTGIAPGMKILDLGSGAGDVAIAAANLVGAKGQVVGIEINPEIVQSATTRVQADGYSNIVFRQGDLNTIEIEDDFDAVIGRLVLMYLKDPATTLKRVATNLKSGAIVAIQETELNIYLSVKHPDTPLTNQLVDWGLEVFKRSGANIGMGFDLFKTFIDAGLPEPTLHLEAPMGCSESWPGIDYLAASFRSMQPLLEKFGIVTAEQLDVDTLAERIRVEITTTKRPLLLPPHIAANTVV